MRRYVGPLLASAGALTVVVGAVIRGFARHVCDPRCSSTGGTVILVAGILVCIVGVLLWSRRSAEP
jgi:hypothetical protein